MSFPISVIPCRSGPRKRVRMKAARKRSRVRGHDFVLGKLLDGEVVTKIDHFEAAPVQSRVRRRGESGCGFADRCRRCTGTRADSRRRKPG